MMACSLFLCVVLTNTSISAEQPAPNAPRSSSTLPKQHALRITSPIASKQIPIDKDLIVSGISTPATNKTSHCQVYVIVNNIKPYQQAKGTGPGGAADYSKWNFVLTSKYTNIKPGPANKITAKYTCRDSPTTASFYSVNVTGVGAAVNNATITKQQQQERQQQQPKVTNATSNAIYTTHQQTSISNGADIRNNITTGTAASLSLGYDKLIYLDNAKFHSGSETSKPIPHDTPFILPFP